MTNYNLVNPYIEGDFEKTYSAQKPLDAAEKVWGKLSGYMTGSVPKFAFTLERSTDKKLFNFLVKEKVKSNVVDYSLTEVTEASNKETVKQFKSKLVQLRKSSQQGGASKKKNKDDDSDSDSDSDSESELFTKILQHKYKHMNQPILYWWYTPTLYQPYMSSVFMPTFVVPLSPYVEFNTLSTAFWGGDGKGKK